MIKGETVILINKVQNGVDSFGAPIYTESEIAVNNVLVGNPGTDEIVSDMGMYGKRLLFVLGIPKGDNHNWEDKEVIIRGHRFRTYAFPLLQLDANVPGPWNLQVKVGMYE